MHLKNMLRQVQSDRSNLAHGWLPSLLIRSDSSLALRFFLCLALQKRKTPQRGGSAHAGSLTLTASTAFSTGAKKIMKPCHGSVLFLIGAPCRLQGAPQPW